MKILSTIACFCLIISINTSFAQSGEFGKREFKKIEHLKSELNLNEEQIAEMEAIKIEMKEKMMTSRSEESIDKRTAFKEMKEAFKARMEAVLTPEQLTKLAEMKANGEIPSRAGHRAERHAMKQEMHQHFEQNILPIIKVKRQQLDAKISSEDQAALTEIRTTLQAFRAKKKEERLNKKGEKKHDFHKREKDAFHRHKKGLKHMMKDHEEEHKTMEALVQKYNTDIEILMDEIKEQTGNWKADRKAIKKEYRPKMHNGKEGKEEKKCEKMDKAYGEKRCDKLSSKKKMMFLLMDPNAKYDELQDNLTEEYRQNITMENEFKIYPNPAGDFQTIELNLPASGDILIEILDNSGKTVKTVFNNFMDKGPQTLKVDLSDLSGTLYLYRVIDSEGNEMTKKLMKTKS